jgi:hypothetical protein
MNVDAIRAVANVVLYEGYMLYPYRPSALKNRSQGWSFGTLLPPDYVSHNPGESERMQGQVLVTGEESPVLTVEVRFLQLRNFVSAPVERTVTAQLQISELVGCVKRKEFQFGPDSSAGCEIIEGCLEISAERCDHAIRLTTQLANRTAMGRPPSNRDDALPRALVAAHALITIEGGEFTSLLDPPSTLRSAASGCHQVGVFPVLIGEEGDRNAMLLSPIILYDYPKIATQSKGDFFDSSEIDEMLSLRVLTLSDSEKEEIRASGGWASQILERTEALSHGDLASLHGTVQETIACRRKAMNDWNPFAQVPMRESVRVFGVELRKGDRVKLWPQKRADILDLALIGKLATIEAIEEDFEDQLYLAVTIDDDPGKDFGELRQPGHRFFFLPEEVEPVGFERSASGEKP